MDTSTIQVPVLRKDIAKFTVIGTNPLLTSKKPEIGFGVKIRAPQDEHEAYLRTLYKFESGGVEHYGFPASGIKKSMVSACAHCSAVKMHTKSRVFVETDQDSEDYVKLWYPEGKGPYAFNSPAGKDNGATVPCVYGRFDLWAITFNVRYFVETIPKETIVTLLTIAGEMIAWGARRVETGDNRVFGTFRFAQPKEIEEVHSKWTTLVAD